MEGWFLTAERRNRTLEIFYRGIRGEDLSPASLADECNVLTRNITRNFNEIMNFLADNRNLVGHSEFEYSQTNKSYRLVTDEFLSDKEMFLLSQGTWEKVVAPEEFVLEMRNTIEEVRELFKEE